MWKVLSVVIAAMLQVGCTSVHVTPVDPSVFLKHACIQDNPKVIVDDFVPVLRDGFSRHGISTEVYAGQPPEQCQVLVTYTARRSWDLAPYLSHAELRLENREGLQLAYAEYHLRLKGGYSPMKWQGTRAKMEPVIDELLKAYGTSAQPAIAADGAARRR
jgi:hypothetical protein